MDWFEKKNSGWYGYYGKFWEAYKQMTDPDARMLVTKELGGLPALPGVSVIVDFPTARHQHRTDGGEGRAHALFLLAWLSVDL